MHYGIVNTDGLHHCEPRAPLPRFGTFSLPPPARFWKPSACRSASASCEIDVKERSMNGSEATKVLHSLIENGGLKTLG